MFYVVKVYVGGGILNKYCDLISVLNIGIGGYHKCILLEIVCLMCALLCGVG